MSNHRQRVNLPGVGIATIGYDHILIGTNTRFDDLALALPLPELTAAFHQFQFYQHAENPYYWSEINLTCSPDDDGLAVLRKYEAALSRHASKEIEIAIDVACASFEDVASTLLQLVGVVFKRHHRRNHLRVAHEENQADPPPGCLPLPTFYFESGKSGVRLKLYARQVKRLRDQYGGFIARIEWTLTGQSITRQLRIGTRRVSDLAKADLLDFVHRNLVIAEIDHERLGALILTEKKLESLEQRKSGSRYASKGMTTKEYWSRRASYLYLFTRAIRDEHLLGGEDWATKVCQESPAQIAGYFKELQAKEQHGLSKRPEHGPNPKVRFSDYELGKIIKKRRIVPLP